MIVGDRGILAIESNITNVLENQSQMALGSFLVHIGEYTFGVNEPNATLLGCSYQEVCCRLERRGMHQFPLLVSATAIEVATAYLNAVYFGEPRVKYFGLSEEQFLEKLYSSKVIWASDGDAAFDDGGHILQFDVDGYVRVLGFLDTVKITGASGAVVEQWLDADFFYSTLLDWKISFEMERSRQLKTRVL